MLVVLILVSNAAAGASATQPLVWWQLSSQLHASEAAVVQNMVVELESLHSGPMAQQMLPWS
jgi:hypothetical protein